MARLIELYYGEPGSAKTRSILSLVAQALKEQPALKVRAYVGDGSKLMYLNSGLVDKGVVHLMDYTIRDYPFTTCQQICDGWWPSDVDDPQSPMRRLTPQEVGETAFWIYEGASVMGNYMMGDRLGGLAQRAAAGEQIGEKANVRIIDNPLSKDDKLEFGGNAPAHYGLGQRHINGCILRTKALPGMVIWTAHERVDTGEQGGYKDVQKFVIGEKVIGPDLIGKALTGAISREFNNTLHFTLASKKVQDGTDKATGKPSYRVENEYRVYTRDHYDPDGIVTMKYRAVNRGMNPKNIKDFYTSKEPGQGLIEFYGDFNKSNQL